MIRTFIDLLSGASARVLDRQRLADLLTTLAAGIQQRLPPDEAMLGLLIGSALGLTLAHWLAFRLAAHLCIHRDAVPGHR